MNTQAYSLQHRGQRALVGILMIIALITSGYVALPAQQSRSPVFVIEAPVQVQVGDRIEVQLIVDHARDLAGYEGQLLFDPSAAHFSGLHQRDSDLKKFGRDVIPLEAPELPDGVAMGLASCPFTDCVTMQGNAQPGGANGRVRLGTVLIGTDQEGILELSFEHLKFVDSQGNVIAMDVPRTKITVQVGPSNGRFSVPASTWQAPNTPGAVSSLDITGEGAVSYADAMEESFEWKLGRERGQPCGPTNDLTRDVNGDSCIDVQDIQMILANASGTPRRAQSGNLSSAGSSTTTADAQVQVQAVTAAITFTVNSTGDAADSNVGDGICATSAGECTLRAAINEANKHTGPDTITFNIPGTGVQTIQLTSRLPSLWDGSGGTTIDGYSQPGAQPNTDGVVSNARIMIQIRGNGPSSIDGMFIQSAGNRVQGLAIFNMHRSIWISGTAARNNLIVGNFIGTDATGTFGVTAQTSNAIGVAMDLGANGNYVGGTSPAERNVISGNGYNGIDFKSQGTDGNLVINNLVGLNPAGTKALANMRHGIDINAGASRNIIGGTAAGQRNIVSGNVYQAIEISHDTATTANQVIGNCVGTDSSCNTGPTWAKNRQGVHLEDGVNNNIIAYNVIGNNPTGGIMITGSGSNRNQVHDNRIGISPNNTDLYNGFFGIQLATTTKFNTIGPNNIIANNALGVQLLDDGTDFNTITRNSIFNNIQLGIDLGPTADVSPNDSGDADVGPNEVLNWPVLTSATTGQVTGTACADSVVPKPCTIEIFIAERRTNDNGGGNYGQGKTFVGSGTTNTNGAFAVAISGVTAGQYLTATATDASGDTSEFSQNIVVASGGGGGGTTTYASDQFSRTVVDGWGSANTGGSYTLSGTASNFDVNGSAGTMVVSAAGGALYATLPSVNALDVDFILRVTTDKLAAGNNQCAFFFARSVTSSSQYRAQIRIASNNAVYIRATKAVNGTHIMLGTEVALPGLTYTPGTYIWMRGEIVGTNPTTIRLRAWADGQAEPSTWQFTVTDSEPSLQAAGPVGLRSFLASGVTNAPVTFSFDDLLVTAP